MTDATNRVTAAITVRSQRTSPTGKQVIDSFRLENRVSNHQGSCPDKSQQEERQE
jgi:hypothetical protein